MRLIVKRRSAVVCISEPLDRIDLYVTYGLRKTKDENNTIELDKDELTDLINYIKGLRGYGPARRNLIWMGKRVAENGKVKLIFED